MIAKVTVMNKILEQALLYDFYGELLTTHQKEVYEQFILEDLSLSEIAESAGISRQGVHDLIRRCQRALEGYEAKLHLVERFLSVKEKVGQIDMVLAEWEREKKNPEDIVKRMDGRRVCSHCGTPFHLESNPPKKPDVCDVCGGELIERDDDKPETVRHRLEIYHQSTEPLKDFYQKRGKLDPVAGAQGTIEATTQAIVQILEA